MRLPVLATFVLALLLLSAPAVAGAAPIWNVESEARPAVFQPSDGSGNDEYRIEIENLGSASTGTITMVDHLPPGVTTTAAPREENDSRHSDWQCGEGPGQTVVTCTSPVGVEPVGTAFDHSDPHETRAAIVPIIIPVAVTGATPGEAGANLVTVSGGGAPSEASSSNTNPIDGGSNAKFRTAFFDFRARDANGEPFTQAGGHPWAITTDFQFAQEIEPGVTDAALQEGHAYRNVDAGEEPRTIVAELPLGLIGNPQALPRCTQHQFTEAPPGGSLGDNTNACPSDTRVGVLFLEVAGFIGPYQVFNLNSATGHAAEFGFIYLGVPITLYGDVTRSSRGYVLRVSTLAPQLYSMYGASLTFFGDPATAFETGGADRAFLTGPADCVAGEEARQLQLHVDTWTNPGTGDPFDADFNDPDWAPADATLPPVEGCSALTFNPSLTLQPSTTAEGGTTQADEPSGYNVNLQVPQAESYAELATPELKTATVTLPRGFSISPSAANGLEACSGAQIGLESNEPGSCPLPSQIATAKLTTPLLESPVEGRVFIGAPECDPCNNADAESGRLVRLFLEVHSTALGVTIKLPGTVKLNPATGQLTAQFAENPQLPFSDLELNFKNGSRAPLANPQTCGTFTTVSELEPWSAPGTPTAVSESPFAITGCESSLPFAPSFIAGTASSAAAAYSSFSVSFTRNDGEQNLSGVTLTSPPGLLGEIAGIHRCGEAEANAGSCSSASQIGTTTASAGPGSDPYTIAGGRVYLTGPYNRQPFGLSIVVPAVAGPFNLGDVVVRASIAVNPNTAALAIAVNPLPQIVDGVPVRLRTVDVEVNRPNFTLNATNCSTQSISATLTGEHPIGSGEPTKTSTASIPYAPSGCASLPFKPELTASAGGSGSKAGGSSFDVKLASAGVGQANIAKVDLQLPKALSTRDSTLNKACIEAQFATNPAGCPEGSIIGKATIHTPILSASLSGPAYLVSRGGAAFPDVEIVLQGEGVTLVLDGKTDIKKGITYSNFESTPDAPFTSFETELPTGPHSIFTANVPARDRYSLCGTSLAMPTRIVGQNGAVLEQNTKIPVTGCEAAKPLTRAQKLSNALRVCKRHRKMRKREACERTARKKYQPLTEKKAKSRTSNGKRRR
jgi:hypothetical protein